MNEKTIEDWTILEGTVKEIAEQSKELLKNGFVPHGSTIMFSGALTIVKEFIKYKSDNYANYNPHISQPEPIKFDVKTDPEKK